jgi:broad specificity phosphatase PhoE
MAKYGVRDLPSLFSVLGIRTAFTLARFIEDATWQQKIYSTYSLMFDREFEENFEEREIKIIVLDSAPGEIMEHLRKKSPFSNDKMAGVLIGSPEALLSDHNRAPALRALTRALHYLHEIDFYSRITGFRAADNIGDNRTPLEGVVEALKNNNRVSHIFDPHPVSEVFFFLEALADMERSPELEYPRELKGLPFTFAISEGERTVLTSIIDRVTVLSRGRPSDLHARRYLRLAPLMQYFGTISTVRHVLALLYLNPEMFFLLMERRFFPGRLRPVDFGKLFKDYKGKVSEYAASLSLADKDRMPSAPEENNRSEDGVQPPDSTMAEDDGETLEPVPGFDGKILIHKKSGRIRFGNGPVARTNFELWAGRHGITEANSIPGMLQGQSDEAINQLTPKGKEQAANGARKLFSKLKDKVSPGKKVVVITSRLKRTQDSAQPFIELVKAERAAGRLEWDVEVADHEALMKGADESHYGISQNKKPDQISSDEWKRIRMLLQGRDVTVRPTDGESFLDLLVRAQKWLTMVNALYPGRTVVLFGHGLFINALRVLLKDESLLDKEGYINYFAGKVFGNGEFALLTGSAELSISQTHASTGTDQKTRSEIRTGDDTSRVAGISAKEDGSVQERNRSVTPQRSELRGTTAVVRDQLAALNKTFVLDVPELPRGAVMDAANAVENIFSEDGIASYLPKQVLVTVGGRQETLSRAEAAKGFVVWQVTQKVLTQASASGISNERLAKVLEILPKALPAGVALPSGVLLGGPQVHVHLTGLTENNRSVLIRHFAVVLGALVSLRGRLLMNIDTDEKTAREISEKIRALSKQEGIALAPDQLKIVSSRQEDPFLLKGAQKVDALVARNSGSFGQVVYRNGIGSRWVTDDAGDMKTLAAALTTVLYAALDRQWETDRFNIHKPSEYDHGALLATVLQAIQGYLQIRTAA